MEGDLDQVVQFCLLAHLHSNLCLEVLKCELQGPEVSSDICLQEVLLTSELSSRSRTVLAQVRRPLVRGEPLLERTHNLVRVLMNGGVKLRLLESAALLVKAFKLVLTCSVLLLQHFMDHLVQTCRVVLEGLQFVLNAALNLVDGLLALV